MEKILLFQVPNATEVRRALAPLHMKVEEVETKDFRKTLEAIYADDGTAGEIFCGEVPKESLMVFCHLTDRVLDRVLAVLKRKHISVDYKAVMTPTNAKWNILRIYFEMERERSVLSPSNM